MEKKNKKTTKHKRITEDGRVWYYYPKKKKLGRKKKRGPKKKKKETWVRRTFEPWNFKIVLCKNKTQVKFIKRFHNELEVDEYKQKLKENNENVVLPILHTNSGRVDNKVYECVFEYIILKKKSNEDEESFNLPNKYGKLVPHVSNNKNWIIWDKLPCLIEETFWVFGYDKVNERKDIKWIYNFLIQENILSKYNFLRIFVYNNKLIILDDYNNIEIIICKNISDCIRLYNKLKECFCVKNKNVLFHGRLKRGNEKLTEIISLIRKKTGWTYNNICRTSTRH